jgi:hypothetical protein
MDEHWKHVIGYGKSYAVSDRGRVFSFNREQLLSQNIKRRKNLKSRGSDKYYFVELSNNGIAKRFYVHTLVLTAFRGPRQEGQECRHLDGNPLNNNLSNLEWGTYWDNRADWYKHRKKIKLTPELVEYIRTSTKSLRELATELGVSKSTVHYARGSYWNLNSPLFIDRHE